MKNSNALIFILVTGILIFSSLIPSITTAKPAIESPIGSLDTSNVIFIDRGTTAPRAMAPVWPSSWTLIDEDPNEDGTKDDERDVQYAYYNTDAEYLYFRLQMRAAPSLATTEVRFKWFIDTNNCDLTIQGGNFANAEYLLFVEDHDNNGTGELYLLDSHGDGQFTEYKGNPCYYYICPGQPIIDPNIAGFNISGVYVDMYVARSAIGNPSQPCITWATDQENPNLEQAPETDKPDMVPTYPPPLTVDKTANPSVICSGQTVTYTYSVTNIRSQNLFCVTVTDNQSGIVPLYVSGDDGDNKLETGETWVYTATASPTQDLTNTATARANTSSNCSGNWYSNTDSASVTVNQSPTANLTGTPLSGCAPLTTTFSDNSTGSPDSWSWSFPGGNPTTPTGKGPHIITYNNAGTYNASLTVSNACGSHTETKNNYITVNPTPIANFYATPTSGPASLTVTFSDNSTGPPISWNWNFGDSTPNSNVPNPTHQYSSPGTYTITLIVTNSYNCSDDEIKTGYITVSQAPTAPTVDPIEIYDTQACDQAAVALMDPQSEYWVKVHVSLGSNQLSQLETVQVTLWYDADGIPGPVPITGNVHDCAILICTVGAIPAWSIDRGTSTTWEIVGGDSVQPDLDGPSGSWKFAFIPGTVARMNTGSAEWDAEAKAIRNPAQIGYNHVYGKDMNFYSEVSVTGSVDWGEVDLGLKFEDAPPNSQPVSKVNYIANGDYNQEIQSSATWTGGTETVTLDETEPGTNPPNDPGKFALMADDDDTLTGAVIVKTTSSAIDATGTITEEAGDDVTTNNLWLSLSASGIAPVTYSGTIYYEITER